MQDEIYTNTCIEYVNSTNELLKTGNINVVFSIFPSHKGWDGQSITHLGRSFKHNVKEATHGRGVVMYAMRSDTQGSKSEGRHECLMVLQAASSEAKGF